MPVNTIISLRKGTSSTWTSTNPVLASGEPGFDITNKILKIGDGISNWNSLTSHNHSSSDITNFNSSVSGLFPITEIVAGTNVSIVASGTSFTISASGTSGGGSGLTTEEVDDRVSNLLVSGSGIFLNYNDIANTLTISTSGLQPSGNYANSTHSHILNDISNINGNRGDIGVNNSGTTWVLNSGIINTQHLNSEIIIDCGLIFETTPPVTTDPYFAQVNLLAHFNNTHNSTAFIDSSSFNRTLTRTGANAVISTTQSKFGGSSLYLGATGGSHYLTSTTISSVGIQDYVIEGWFYFSSLTGLNRALFGWGQDNLYVSALSNKLVLTVLEGDNTTGSATLLNNTWHHIALVRRYNNSITIYCDGVATLIITANNWGRNNNMGSVPVVVGGGSSYFEDKNFYIDDFRVTINQPRYTGNFTPPTTTFEDS